MNFSPLNYLVALLKKSLPAVLLLGSLSLALAPRATAQMTLTITETGGNTTIAYSGSWDTWTSPYDSTPHAAFGQLSASGFAARADPDSGSSNLKYADDGSWGTAMTFVGVRIAGSDSFSFNQFGVVAPRGFTVGDPISGSVLFSGVTVAELGLPSTSGVINMTGGAGISWTSSVSAVPEPSSFAAIFGVIALGGAACRRRKMRS